MATNPIKYSDIIQADSSIEDAINSLNSLLSALEKARQAAVANAKDTKSSLESTSLSAEGYAEALKKATAEAERLKTSVANNAKAQSELKERIDDLSLALAKQASKGNDSKKAIEGATGSYARLKSQLDLTIKGLENMSASERENILASARHRENIVQLAVSTESARLAINKLVAEGKNLAKETENDSTSIAGLKESLRQTTSEFEKLTEAQRTGAKGQELSATIKDQVTELEQLKAELNQTIELGKEDAKIAQTREGSYDNVKLSLAQVTKQYQALSQAQKSSPEGQALLTRQKELIASSQKLASEKKRLNDVTKLEATIAESAEGSYNRLAAQYALNKINLNAMSKEERSNTEEGRKLEQQTLAIYTEMERLQEATGKHALSVGHYSKALQNSESVMRNWKENLIETIANGGKLSPTMVSAAESVKGLGTALWGLVANPVGAVIAAIVVAMVAFVAILGKVREVASRNVNEAENLNKAEAALMVTFEYLYDKIVKVVGVYIQVYGAIINAVAATLEYLHVTNGLTDAVKEYVAVEELRAKIGKNKRKMLEEEATLEEDISSKRTEASDKEKNNGTQRLKVINEAIKEQERLNNIRRTQAKMEVDLASAEADRYPDDIKRLNELTQARVNLIHVEGRGNAMTRELNDAKNEAMSTIKTERSQAEAEARRKRQAAIDAEKLRVELLMNELQDIHRHEDEKTKLLADGEKKRFDEVNQMFEREIDALKLRLEKEKNLTQKSRDTIAETIITLRARANKAALELASNERVLTQEGLKKQAELRLQSVESSSAEAQRLRLSIIERDKTIELELNKRLEEKLRMSEADINAKYAKLITQETIRSEAQRTILQATTRKERLKLQLDAMRQDSFESNVVQLQIIEEERTIELNANRQLTEELRQDEAEINAKYDRLKLKTDSDNSNAYRLRMFDDQQKLDKSEFELLEKSEKEKTAFKIKQEKERLEKILALDALAADKMTAQQRKTIENQVKLLGKELVGLKSFDVYSLVGLDLSEKKKEAISDATQFAVSQLSEILSANLELANVNVQKANERVATAQTALDKELEARNAGYAFNVEQAQKELALQRSNQRKALAEQEEAAKAQEAINTAVQASSLTTAAAKIWGALAEIPFLAVAAIGVMFGSFIAAKIKASQVSSASKKVTYGDGGYEELEGGSHASGNDIPIGRTKDGTPRFAEGGEAMAIFNRRTRSKYGDFLPHLVDSLNKGVFEMKYGHSLDRGIKEVNTSVVNNVIDLGNIGKDISAIRKNSEVKRYALADGTTVEYKGNTKRIIRTA